MSARDAGFLQTAAGTPASRRAVQPAELAAACTTCFYLGKFTNEADQGAASERSSEKMTEIDQSAHPSIDWVGGEIPLTAKFSTRYGAYAACNISGLFGTMGLEWEL